MESRGWWEGLAWTRSWRRKGTDRGGDPCPLSPLSHSLREGVGKGLESSPWIPEKESGGIRRGRPGPLKRERGRPSREDGQRARGRAGHRWLETRAQAQLSSGSSRPREPSMLFVTSTNWAWCFGCINIFSEFCGGVWSYRGVLKFRGPKGLGTTLWNERI